MVKFTRATVLFLFTRSDREHLKDNTLLACSLELCIAGLETGPYQEGGSSVDTSGPLSDCCTGL